MSYVMIAASIPDYTRQADPIGCAAVLTPRSPHGARGVTGVDELRITAAMIDHPSLQLLFELAVPCFATTPREVAR